MHSLCSTKYLPTLRNIITVIIRFVKHLQLHATKSIDYFFIANCMFSINYRQHSVLKFETEKQTKRKKERKRNYIT